MIGPLCREWSLSACCNPSIDICSHGSCWSCIYGRAADIVAKDMMVNPHLEALESVILKTPVKFIQFSIYSLPKDSVKSEDADQVE